MPVLIEQVQPPARIVDADAGILGHFYCRIIVLIVFNPEMNPVVAYFQEDDDG
jgi:hypothetical protein